METESKKRHLIIVIIYDQLDIIKKSLDSIFDYDADFCVIENPSDNSEAIEKYVLTKNPKKYIRYVQNVTNNAVTQFNREHSEFIKQYDYITYTDGDLLVYDVKELFNEIFEALKKDDCVVSSADLWSGNSYVTNYRASNDRQEYLDIKDRKNINDFMLYMKNNPISFGSKKLVNGNFFITVKNSNIDFIISEIFLDAIYQRKFRDNWYSTSKNLVYHLTWDLYVDGNSYYEFKKVAYPRIWASSYDERTEFITII